MSRAFAGKPLDQGQTGTCTAHAAVHFIHCSPKAHTKFLDPWKLYREIVLLDEYTDNDSEATLPDVPGHINMQQGSSGTGAAKALDKRGLLVDPPGYLWADKVEDGTLWVLTRSPVLLGCNWYDTMETPTPEGFVKIGPRAVVVGGHEFIWRGVDVKRGVDWFVNSWGPKWNAHAKDKSVPPGHFMMDHETVARLFREDGDVVSPIER